MWSARSEERIWAIRLIGKHLFQTASLRLAGRMMRLLPLPLRQQVAELAVASCGRRLPLWNLLRIAAQLQALGLGPESAAQMRTRARAGRWLRQVRLGHLQRAPIDELQQHLRAMNWNDPGCRWLSAGGRRRVVCLLPTGDLELALAALIDRPGSPAHYFICSPHRADSLLHRRLLMLQRRGHRLDVAHPRQHGAAWRTLQRGATVIMVLDASFPEGQLHPTHAEPPAVRIARLAGVPLLLLGHRTGDNEQGTLHVVDEFAGDRLRNGAPQLQETARQFLREAPHDWHHLLH